jgi:hypothetical protein
MPNDRENWLKEHLPYELSMMRHSLSRLTKFRGLDWNMALAAFATYARNLRRFLTNGDEGKNNFKACDLVQNFKSSRTDLSVIIRNKLNPSIFHLDKERPTDSDASAKLNLAEAIEISEWIETEMEDFVGKLPEETKKLWDNSVKIERPVSLGSLLDGQTHTSSAYAIFVTSAPGGDEKTETE